MKRIITILTLTILLFGCTDFLVEEPKTTQSDVLTLSEYSGLNKATLGAYTRLVHERWYGAGFVLDAEMRSGNGKRPGNTDYTSGRYTVPYGWDYNQNSTPGLWEHGYYAISMANNVMDNLTEDKLTPNVTQQDLNNLQAECLFLRALSHFDMVRLYAQSYRNQPDGPGIPYVFHTDPADLPERNTVREVYDFIVADLKQAETLIADNYVRLGIADPTAACTKPAIQALLSRAYLYMGQWQNAADYATRVINNTKYRMWTDAEYLNVWGMDVPSAGEVIFEAYGSTTNSYDAYWEANTWMTSPSGYADCAASNDLVYLYDQDDVRGQLFRGVDDVDELFWSTKYIGKGRRTPDVSNTIVLRLSEMYLNRAEAIVNGANVSGVTAASDLNMITSNRKGATYSAATQEDVFQERRKELAWEGHLWFDLSRLGRPLVRTDYTGTSNKDIPYPDSRWAMPIAQRELDANPNLVQNPGY